MKTDKVVTKDEMEQAYADEYYSCIFEKKTAKLFMITDIKTLTATFSVFERNTHKEPVFTNMADAVQHYNYL